MKKISILTVLVCVLGFGFVTIFSDSAAKSPQKVRKVIEASNRDFIRWFNDGKLDSLVSLYRDDACLSGKGCGKAVVTAYFKTQMLVGFKFKELTTTSVTVEKSVAVEKGTYVLEIGNGQIISGDYFTEWKLTNKEWRISSDMANVSSVQPEASKSW